MVGFCKMGVLVGISWRYLRAESGSRLGKANNVGFWKIGEWVETHLLVWKGTCGGEGEGQHQ